MNTHLHFNQLCSDFLFFPVSKESAGAVDEEDFIKAFTDVPTVQVQTHTKYNKMHPPINFVIY